MDTPADSDTPPPLPPQPPAPKPKGIWGMILTATPVALTALATAFAGLSSSEMTQSMYHRSLAAQQQSKAGDQWAFFQAKRIRGSGLETSGELLLALGHPDPFDAAHAEAALARAQPSFETGKSSPLAHAIKKAREQFKHLHAVSATLATPEVVFTPLPDATAREKYEAAVAAIGGRKPEADTMHLVAELKPATIEEAIRLAEDDADKFDKSCEPINDAIKKVRAALKELGSAAQPFRTGPSAQSVAALDRLDASFRAAAMDYEARRYRLEAGFNRRAAEAYEVQVRRSALQSDKFRLRSKQFFYSMLLAQVGVTLSSLALARAHRSVLWLLAAVVGIVSLAFTAYVYVSF